MNWVARPVAFCCLSKDFPARLQTSWKEALMQEMAAKAASRKEVSRLSTHFVKNQLTPCASCFYPSEKQAGPEFGRGQLA